MKKKDEIIDAVTIDAKYQRESSKSICLDCEGDLEWFPKKEVHFDSDKNELTMPMWLAKKKFPGEF